MTVCVTPINQSGAQPTKFQLQISRIANTVFQLTNVDIPGITLNPTSQVTPFVDLPVPGDKLQFDTLNFNFLVDSRYDSWYELFVWVGGLGFPERFQQYANLKSDSIRRPGQLPMIGIRPPYADATLIIYSNKNNPQMTLSFKDCFPIRLEKIKLDYQASAANPLICQCSMAYSYFTVKKN